MTLPSVLCVAVIVVLCGFNQANITAHVVHDRVVATLAIGSDPHLLSSDDCTNPYDRCDAGFGMAGPNQDLYFYDFGADNVKIIPLRAASKQRLIPGLAMDPEDGVVTRDGTVYLLVDRWNHGPMVRPRFVVQWRSTAEEQWRELPLPDSDEEQQKVITYGATTIVSTADDDIYVARQNGTSIRIAVQGTPVDGAATAMWISVEIPGRKINKADGARSLYSDRMGRVYSIMWLNDALTARRHAPSGEVVDAIVIPIMRTTRPIVGKGSLLVSPEGTLLGLQVTEAGLIVREFAFN